LLPVRVLSKERRGEYGKVTLEIDYGSKGRPLVRKYSAGVILDTDIQSGGRETVWEGIQPEESFVLRPVSIGSPIGDYLPTFHTNGGVGPGVGSVEFIHINHTTDVLTVFFDDKDMITD
jgi:hypothetical protein